MPRIDTFRDRLSDLSASPYPLVVAEMSANHGGALRQALDLLGAIAKTDADAAKIQTYHPHGITLDHDGPAFKVSSGLWSDRTLFDLYREGETPRSWHSEMFSYARDLDLPLFSAPFDVQSVDFLEQFDPVAYKIASCELVDMPLIRAVAQTGRPVILSTGMGTLAEIEEAVNVISAGNGHLACILHCVSAYPTPPQSVNLARLQSLIDRFAVPIGFSDHTETEVAAIASVAMGAQMIERHVKADHDDTSLDAGFSMPVSALDGFVGKVCQTRQMAGDGAFGPSDAEMESFRFRRSLFVAQDMEEGDTFTADNVRSIRPSGGLHTRHLTEVIGRRASRRLEKGTPLEWGHVGSD